MNQKKIGAFISTLRKEQGCTQKDLAEQLSSRDKTISKWGTEKGLPDIASLKPLCDILQININELLSGEKVPPVAYTAKTEENIMHLLNKNQSNKKLASYKMPLALRSLRLHCFSSHQVAI